MSGLFDKTTGALSKSLDMLNVRANTISANIANAETPGYKAKQVDFENALADALQSGPTAQMSATSPGHFPIKTAPLDVLQADVYDNPDVEVSPDGNTVNLEREMASLAENSISYKSATQLINKKLGSLKYAISGGR